MCARGNMEVIGRAHNVRPYKHGSLKIDFPALRQFLPKYRRPLCTPYFMGNRSRKNRRYSHTASRPQAAPITAPASTSVGKWMAT